MRVGVTVAVGEAVGVAVEVGGGVGIGDGGERTRPSMERLCPKATKVMALDRMIAPATTVIMAL
jgi:hypothetical protein